VIDANAQQERLLALEGSETPAVRESFLDRHKSGLPAQLSPPLRGTTSSPRAHLVGLVRRSRAGPKSRHCFQMACGHRGQRAMRHDWMIMTPLEAAMSIAATVLLSAGFVMVAMG